MKCDVPIVSVIIPTYKDDGSLTRAIESVLTQDFQSFEVIVVDDNDPSSDYRVKTENLMKRYCNDKKVIYIRHEKNKNGSAARNTGFKKSKGKYICLLDDDDVFLKNKIRKQVEYMDEHPEYGACYTWRKESMLGNEIIVKTSITGDMSQVLLLLEATPYTSALMLRRECYEALNGFDESYYRHQDFEFMLRFFEKFKIGVVEEPLVRRIGNAVDNQPHGQRLIDIKKKFFDQFDAKIREIDTKIPGFRKRVYVRHYTDVIKDQIKHGDLKLLFKTICSLPVTITASILVLLFKDGVDAVKRRKRNHTRNVA